MKSPDEIKKGLEICIGTCRGDKTACPYRMDFDLCLDIMHSDALALIQQLEAENAELLEKNEQLKRERDALLHDMRYVLRTEVYDNVCNVCNKACIKEHGCKNADWRGLCYENGGVEE